MTIQISPRLLLLVLIVVVAAIVAPQAPEIQRYLKVKQM